MRVYILDPKKHKWIVKGRFRDAIEFEESVFQFWDQTKFGMSLTIFLVSHIYIYDTSLNSDTIGK